MLSNAYFLAKFRFDTAENEPAKNVAKIANLSCARREVNRLSGEGLVSDGPGMIMGGGVWPWRIARECKKLVPRFHCTMGLDVLVDFTFL